MRTACWQTSQMTKFHHPLTRNTEQTSEYTRVVMQTCPLHSGLAPAAPFVFGTDPTSVRDNRLRIALSRHLTDRFTFMNGRIKGLAQNLKDAEGRHKEFRRQTNNHLNEMRVEDTDTRCTKREPFH
jgi:hypothetical protein